MTMSLMLAMSGIAYGVKVQRAATHDVQVMQEKFNHLQATLKSFEDEEMNWYRCIVMWKCYHLYIYIAYCPKELYFTSLATHY